MRQIKNQKMDLGPTWMPLRFENDPDTRLYTKKYQRAGFSHVFIIEPFLKKIIPSRKLCI